MSETKTNNPNPWGEFYGALKPKKPKGNVRVSKSLFQVVVANKDTQEWVDRCNISVANMDAIIEHQKAKHPTMRFIKREFYLACIERGIAEFAKQEGIKLS